MDAEISIVLGSYNRLPFLKAAIRSIRENKITVPYEIIVVDGGSDDGSMRWLSKQKDIVTILQHNHGEFQGKKVQRRSWGYFMNLGFKAAQGSYICMISDDTLLIPHAVMNGMRYIEQRAAEGIQVGAAAFYWRNAWPVDRQYMVSRTVGDTIFVNHGIYVRSALEAVHWLDENHYQFYCADIDVCLRLKQAGYDILAVPDAFVEHYYHASISARQQISPVKSADEANFIQRWKDTYPEVEQGKIVREPLIKKYEDPDRTGYRLYPRFEHIRITLQRLLSRITNRILRMIKGK